MTDPRDLERALDSLLETTQPKQQAWLAQIARVDGRVTVPDHPELTYIRMPSGAVVKVVNVRVAPAEFLQVMVGYDPLNPSVLQVLTGLNHYSGQVGAGGSGGGTGGGAGIGLHALTHTWLSSDVVYAQARQLMPLRVSVASGLEVRIEPSPMQTAAGWGLSPAGTLDLTAYVPASGARYVFIYLDEDGVFSARSGAIVPSGLSYGAIPAALPGETPMAAVRLAAGQTDIVESLARADVVDLRFAGNQESAAAAVGGIGWFNVRDYGAVGDGAADDTSAVSLAIAALTAAGGGVLYFPSGVYVTVGGFTLSVNCSVCGVGDYWVDSQVICTDATAVLFQIDAESVNFQDLYFLNNHATPTAGNAINGNASVNGQHINLTRCTLDGFFDNIVYLSGSNWAIDNCWIGNQRRYALFVSNFFLADQGDWSIVNSTFTCAGNSPDAAIRVASSGGGKIVNCKINSAAAGFNYGIDVVIDGSTSILLISNCSIENVRASGIRISNVTGETFKQIIINGNQFGMYNNGTSPAIVIDADSAADISEVVISDNVFLSDDTVPFVVEATNVDNIRIVDNVTDGYTAILDQTTCTNVVLDGSGSVTSVATGTGLTGGPITTSGTVALADTAVTPGSYTNADITVDAQGRLTAAADGSGEAALQVLMSGDSPPDPLTNDADDDWLYG